MSCLAQAVTLFDLCSEGDWFECWSEYHTFLVLATELWGGNSHDRFAPHPRKSLIYHYAVNICCESKLVTSSLNQQQIDKITK